ncbi:MAG: transporter, partial [Casimicrobiaceae bacterium]
RAASELRERYAAYRTAWDLAHHARQEIVPLRRRISEEILLRYNGMLIDVFALLADAREQAAAVASSIEALAQFWKAEALLEAAFLSQPRSRMLPVSSAEMAGGDDGKH